ncbi:fimbrial protein [Pluralibacter sp.]|uniref:fimbrial protein n=1 Tax=Pluralibacter sp. TaxID=1920032 RepID=UPI0025CD5DBE|nr:fimbrial protein [Pluralibacter sp.]MBV8042162.1 type 1 fimbrial protein [Pluralibacter sp.]
MKFVTEKKSALLLVACCGLFSATGHTATTNSVNIDITGTVIASPCVVNGGQNSLSVNLGDSIEANSLSVAGDTSSWKDFVISLSSCPLSTSSFSVAFSGTPDTDDATTYKNTGTATNLKLALTTHDGAVLGDGTTIDNVDVSTTHAYDLQLRARAVSKGAVMPGTIQGQVQATFTYQ